MAAMRRRSFLGLPFALALAGAARAAPVAAALTARDQADLNRIEAYLNGIHTLKARFLQVAPDGSTSEGTAWLDRPGRMRFQYDPPSPLLLVAGHSLFFFHDSQLDQTTNLPIGATPLGLLLADHITLTGEVTVTGITRLPGQPDAGIQRGPAGTQAMVGDRRPAPGDADDAVQRAARRHLRPEPVRVPPGHGGRQPGRRRIRVAVRPRL
jgi:hypothetical protein